MTTGLEKKMFFRFTVCFSLTFINLCVCSSFPFGFEGGMWDLICINS